LHRVQDLSPNYDITSIIFLLNLILSGLHSFFLPPAAAVPLRVSFLIKTLVDSPTFLISFACI